MTPLQQALISEGYHSRDVFACPYVARPEAVLWLWQRADHHALRAFRSLSCAHAPSAGPTEEDEEKVRTLLQVGEQFWWFGVRDVSQAEYLRTLITGEDLRSNLYVGRVVSAWIRGEIDAGTMTQLLSLERTLRHIGIFVSE